MMDQAKSRKQKIEHCKIQTPTSSACGQGLGLIFSRKFGCVPACGRSGRGRDDWDLLDRRCHDSGSSDYSARSTTPELLLDNLHETSNPSIEVEQMLPLKLMLWAAATGDDAALAFLLSSIRFASSVFNYAGQSLLSIASEHGHVEVVKLLLAQDDIDMNLPDLDGQTPLAWAACNGHSSVVNLLLERDELRADMVDLDGNTALSWAAANGHFKVVVSLLERFDIAINPINHHGQTPRQLAAKNRHWNVVDMLSIWSGNDC